jgi:hypothetical protein
LLPCTALTFHCPNVLLPCIYGQHSLPLPSYCYLYLLIFANQAYGMDSMDLCPTEQPVDLACKICAHCLLLWNHFFHSGLYCLNLQDSLAAQKRVVPSSMLHTLMTKQVHW